MERSEANSQSGSASLELIGSLPIVLLAVLVAVQIVIAGAALWSAGVAARAGARAVATGKEPRGAAERALPGVLRGLCAVETASDAPGRSMVEADLLHRWPGDFPVIIGARCRTGFPCLALGDAVATRPVPEI